MRNLRLAIGLYRRSPLQPLPNADALPPAHAVDGSCHQSPVVDSAQSAVPICCCGQCPHSPPPNRLRLICQKAFRKRFACSRDRRPFSTAHP